MNLLTRSHVEHILTRFESGKISLQSAVKELADMPQVPDFDGIWELLIIHICLAELASAFPDIRHIEPHWKREIRAWQQRLRRFLKKPRSSFRNAIRKDFEQAREKLLKNDAIKLLLNVEMHTEDIINSDEIPLAEVIAGMNLEEKKMEWFLNYS
ncbi:hypothetical protein QUF80_14380 [Desulfococcaceae bacterium HSG8]|nr:hypothetical protein [Desulfococcaceae bacterium HSG8]